MTSNFTIPNEASVGLGITDEAEPDFGDFRIIAQAPMLQGIRSGCAVSQRGAGANMSVDVASGTITFDGVDAAVSSTNVAIGASDPTNLRIDFVVSDNTGAISVVAGTAAATAVFPAIPASSVVLAAVYVQATATQIVNANIIDKRMMVVGIMRDGAAGGQTLIGGTAASENLTLQSTFNATRGKILFGNSAYDEVNNRLGISTAAPSVRLDLGTTAGAALIPNGTPVGGTGLLFRSSAGAGSTADGAIWQDATNFLNIRMGQGNVLLFHNTVSANGQVIAQLNNVGNLAFGGYGFVGSTSLTALNTTAGDLTSTRVFFGSLTAPTGFRSDARPAQVVYVWPTTDPSVGQILTASAVASGVSTLSWATPGAVSSGVLSGEEDDIAVLLNGRAGGQQVFGGIFGSENIILRSNTSDTPGFIYIGDITGFVPVVAFDESQGMLGIGTLTPQFNLDINGTMGINGVQMGPYSEHNYIFSPDVSAGVVITSGNAQGVIHHSGSHAEVAVRLYVDAKTVAGANGLPITVQYGDTDSLDTVSVWTTIATYTLNNTKSGFTDTMLASTIPPNRVVRMNVGTIVGSPTDANVSLRVKRQLVN